MTDDNVAGGSNLLRGFQVRVVDWMMETFSMEVCRDSAERNHRFLEEALELVQATRCTRAEAHMLVDYVFNRPVGDSQQEVGGVMVTLAALCALHDFNMSECAERELARCWQNIERIRQKQASKPKHSPLPEAVRPAFPDVMLEAYIAHLVGEASRWEIGSGAHPPLLRKAIQELLTYVYKRIGVSEQSTDARPSVEETTNDRHSDSAQRRAILQSPTGFVAKCRCGCITGALDADRTERADMGKILGQWLTRGCTVEPRFGGTWTEIIERCKCPDPIKPIEIQN
jgi:hypothetical protein